MSAGKVDNLILARRLLSLSLIYFRGGIRTPAQQFPSGFPLIPTLPMYYVV